LNNLIEKSTFNMGAMCDCHVHVIGPTAKYPLVPVRSYTPMDVTSEDLVNMMRRLNLSRAVVVQPSIFGQDNRCTLDAVEHVQEAGLDARAVAVLDHLVSGAELDRMHKSGVRGLRVNLQSTQNQDLSGIKANLSLAEQMCERNGWHVQLFASRHTILNLQAELLKLSVPIVFDHFAGLSPDSLSDDASQCVLHLLENGNTWIKLSGTYRVGHHAFDERLTHLAKTLAVVKADRLVWASDWPHTPSHHGQASNNPAIQPYREIDTARLLSWVVQDWFNQDLAHQVLVKNPGALYGFDAINS